MTHPGDGQSGWGGQPGQGDWGQQHPANPQQYGQPQQGQPQQGQPQYGQPQYGQPPYHQPQYGQPEHGQYGQQNYGGGYGGLGVFSGGEGPPPKKSNATVWIVVGVVVLLLVGGGLTAFLLTRDDGSQTASTTSAPVPTTTAQKPSTTTTSKAGTENKTCKAGKADWNCLVVDSLSYSYDVPKAWAPSTTSAPVNGMKDVKLTGIAVYGNYDCGGARYNRGSTGGVVVPQGDPTAVAKDFAQKLGTQYYSSGKSIDVKLGEPKPVKVPGAKGESEGVQVDATITTTGSDCLATKGMVKVLVFKGSTGLHVFMANADLEGGPAEPKAPTEADLQTSVDSVKQLAG